jgi:hypothetical protein
MKTQILIRKIGRNMKLLIVVGFILSFSFAHAQKKDSTISVVPNKVQIEELTAEQNTIIEHQKKLDRLIELIIGYKKEEIEDLRFENGKFVFKKKK